MEFPVLETSRLRLVQMNTKSLDSYYEIMSNDEVTKYYGMDSLQSREDARKLLESMHLTYENKRGIRWGIVLKENNEFIGTVGLNNLSLFSKRAEIGYELHPNYWGKGITTEAVKEVLRYSFEKLNLNRIGAVTYPENIPSYKLLEKIGFSKEGLLRGYIYQKEQSHDAFVFSILKSEWENQYGLS